MENENETTQDTAEAPYKKRLRGIRTLADAISRTASLAGDEKDALYLIETAIKAVFPGYSINICKYYSEYEGDTLCRDNSDSKCTPE